MRMFLKEISALPRWTVFLLCLNVFCFAVLLLADYPDTPAAQKLIGGGHQSASANVSANESHSTPEATPQPGVPPGNLNAWHWQELLDVGIALFLLLGPPIGSGFLAFDILRGSSAHLKDTSNYQVTKHPLRVRVALGILWFGCVSAYVFLFSETYHVGVLCLALMAWYIAFVHLADLESSHHSLLVSLDKHSGEMQKRMEYSFSNNLKAFYEDFRPRVENADTRVFSVERVWTMPDRWAVEVEADTKNTRFNAMVQVLQNDKIFTALTKTKARDIIFIGPSPRRTEKEGYVGKELEQFYAMVYTTCILELARTKRLADQTWRPTSNESPRFKEERVRIRCAVGDVPCWVKIVDNGFFDMFGTPPFHFGYEPHFHGDDRLRSRVTQYERLILEYENYTQRVYTYVSAELLYWLNDGSRTSGVSEEDLKMFLFGATDLDGNEVRGQLKVKIGVDLLKFFFALHYRTELKLDKLDVSFGSLTYHQLWERCS